MDVRLIDRSRNVTLVPTKAVRRVDDDLYSVMGALAKNADPNQAEFRCDREFIEALERQLVDRRTHSRMLTAAEGAEHVRNLPDDAMGRFDGIPVIVEELS